MFVWVTVGDYAECYVEATFRHCSVVTDSGTLTAATLTTGTTLFDTSNDPTSEMHIGKLYGHDTLTVTDGTTNGASTIGTASNELLLDTSGDTGLTIRSGASSTGVVSFASPSDHNVGQVYYDHNTDSMVIRTNDAIALTINSSQNATFAGGITATGDVIGAGGRFGNVKIGVPTITTSLRGLADAIIEVDQPMRPVHSGMGGGIVPDAFMVLSKIIASFHNEKGDLMIEGLTPTDMKVAELDKSYTQKMLGSEEINLFDADSISTVSYTHLRAHET